MLLASLYRHEKESFLANLAAIIIIGLTILIVRITWIYVQNRRKKNAAMATDHTPAGSRGKLPWIITCVTLGIITLITTFRPPEIVEKPIEVFRERVVDKIVEIPVQIPDEYFRAKQFYEGYWGAPWSGPDGGLVGINAFKINVNVTDVIKEDIEAKKLLKYFTLWLKKRSIPVSEDSKRTLVLWVDGVWNKEHTTCFYMLSLCLTEQAPLLRDDLKWTVVPISSWQYLIGGYAGNQVFEQSVYGTTEKIADVFASAYHPSKR